jgi:N-methylhydantoinase A
MKYLGVDTGGTFTDFVFFDGETLKVHKVLSTPHAPEEAILNGIAEMGISLDDVQVIHGSTVATNAVLEGKGVRTAYISNRGLGDILTIGRQARQSLYDLEPAPVSPPVPESLCLETGGRLGADGVEVEPLTGTHLCQLKTHLEELKPDAVAINLLFSFLDDRFERAIEAIVPRDMFCSRSSSILPEVREYERGITTWLNAYVGPLMEHYILRLQKGLGEAGLSVMQSHGGTISARQAAHHAVRLLLSGPAGGLQGARYMGAQAGFDSLLTFDMGGTSTDVALIDGDIRLTSEGHIDRYPVAVPMVDMHTIGAGGGSIAYLDAGDMLQVGPESSGAQPGPACYGAGGTKPTVTDANLVLGRLPRQTSLGGGMQVDTAAARQAFESLASAMACSIDEAAQGVIRIANDHMAKALRVISVQRGLDPMDYTLTCFGGAGGLHVCELAEALGMKQALVPIHAGVLSALGMLVAPASRQLSHSYLNRLADCSPEDIESKLNQLVRSGEAELAREGVTGVDRKCSLDLRYEGQSSTLQLPWSDITNTVEAFHAAHEQRFGHRMDIPVEVVTLRVGLEASHEPPALPERHDQSEGSPYTYEEVSGIETAVPVYRREEIAVGQRLNGPTLITEKVSTTFIAPGWQCQADGFGNLLLTSFP